MATEHWKEHELPGIHNQPEWAAGWQELPQGAAEGKAPSKARTLPASWSAAWNSSSKRKVELRHGLEERSL